MKLAPLLGPAVLGAIASKTTDFPLPEALKLARDWGIVVVLVWLIYYGVTVVFPRMTQQHADTIKAQSERSAATVATLTDRYAAEMKTERGQREALQTRLVELLEKHMPKE